MYSKNKDQLGPFKGNISPTPLISVPGVDGINSMFKNVVISKAQTATFDTSHTEQP